MDVLARIPSPHTVFTGDNSSNGFHSHLTATMRNDSLVLDPLLTVPIYVHEAPGSKFRKAALCYEIRGHSNAIYNLVSDMCVSINGEFVQMPAPRQHLNALGSVGMVAIDNAGQCLSLIVRHDGDCVASVNGQPVQTSYNRNGISIARSARHVHIKVPDCDHVDLTMWVMCQRVEGYNMMKYVVTRGLNMHPTSHGLIGEIARIIHAYTHIHTQYIYVPNTMSMNVKHI